MKKEKKDPPVNGKLRFLPHEQTTGLLAAKLPGGREALSRERGKAEATID